MANLVDTSVNGDLRVTGTMFGTQAGNYATCATAAGTAAKAVTISGFTLTTGIHVFVKFTVTNTAAVASLTLDVSGTGAKSLKYRGGNLPAVGTLASGRVYEFVYDGTNWELVGDLDTNTQTVTGVKGNAESSYRTGEVNLTPANIGVSATTTSVTVGSTTASIPQATSTSPKMDGTAAVGSETTWAKGDHVHPTDTSRAPTSHASSATTYGVGTTANYGHVKLDNSTPLTVGTTSSDGVATGKAHIHNAIESVARASVTTVDLEHSGTNTRAHMILSQITNSTSTTHDPGDGYLLTFMWDGTGPWDTQIYVPSDLTDKGRLKMRLRANGSWGDWGYLPAAVTATLLTSSDNLNNIKCDEIGNILGYAWKSTSMPSNTAFSDSHSAELLVFGTGGVGYCIQVELRAGRGIYQRRLDNGTWGNWEKVLTSGDITSSSTNGNLSVAGTDVTVYTHPTTSGNKHIPSGGSSGQFLGWDSDGTAKWVSNPNSDTKVKATAKTDNVNYKILATASASPTSGNATEAVYDTDITLNPSTNTIAANVSGTAAKPAVTVLSSQSSDLASYTGSNQGDVLWYRWEASSVPQGAPLVSTSALMCVQRIATNETRQTVYCGSGQIFTRKSVNGTFDYSWSDLGGVSPENYSTGIIFGTNSGGKYYELASIRSVCSLNVTTTSIFLIDRLISNDSKQDLGYLEISSTCTDATTPAFTFSASLVMLSDNVTNAQIKVYGNASTGIAYIYAFGKTTLTANDTGHVGARGILVTAGDISVGIGNLVTFSTSGVILGDAPSGLTAVSIINSTHTHSTDDLTSGVLPVTRGGTGITTTVNKNAVIIGNSSDAAGSMQAIATASGAFYSKGANAKPVFGTLPVAQGGTGLTTTTNKNAVIIGNASSGTGAMQSVATASGAFYSTGTNAKPTFGTLPVAQGGTGLTTVTNVNSVVIGNSSSATGAMQTVAAADGAFYSTGANVKPKFGTLPAAQGGTGKTSAKDACNAFINALDTGSSTPLDADYYVSQYVNGGTTTTTYHRRPMSALWEYINGKLTSVSGVDISGNAATATSASSASKVANPLTLKIKTGTTEGTDLYTYDGSGTKTLDIKQGSNITLTAAAGSLTIAGTADTKNTAGSTDTSSKIFLIGATSQAANPQTYSQDTTYVDTDATLASTKVRVAEKCTLQFNSTTNALDFVFS